MTNEEAKKMLEAKLKCLIAETSGTNHDCNMRLCDGCPLNYEQGNMGEQKEVLEMAIKALSSWDKYSDELWKKAYARGYNDAKIQIAESGEYERAYWRGYDDSRQHELRTLAESEDKE